MKRTKKLNFSIGEKHCIISIDLGFVGLLIILRKYQSRKEQTKLKYERGTAVHHHTQKESWRLKQLKRKPFFKSQKTKITSWQ